MTHLEGAFELKPIWRNRKHKRYLSFIWYVLDFGGGKTNYQQFIIFKTF